MFRPNRFGSVLATALCIALCGWASASRAGEIRDVTERVFPLKPGGSLTIDSQNGRITVEAWDRPEARIQITRVVRANDSKRAAELMKELRADVSLGEGRISIESRYPKRAENVGIWDVLGQRVTALNIHYYVQVPADTRLQLETSNGELRIKGTSGVLVAQTVNGNVDVSSTAGSAEVNTTNGNIRVVGIKGAVHAGTTNGTIEVEIRKLGSGESVELETTNGDVTATLPAELKAQVNASTTNGRVSVGYPIDLVGRASSKMVQGMIGGGGSSVHLQTTNGNIVLMKMSATRSN